MQPVTITLCDGSSGPDVSGIMAAGDGPMSVDHAASLLRVSPTRILLALGANRTSDIFPAQRIHALCTERPGDVWSWQISHRAKARFRTAEGRP